MARPPKNPDAAGVYRRGKWYWLRHSVSGEEIRQPLRTQSYEEACAKAKELRGKAINTVARGEWESVISRYLREKQSDKRPAGFVGRRWQTMRPGTAVKVRSCLRKFAEWTGVASPSKVTVRHLEDYLAKHAKSSKAGARTTLATIQAFLGHVGCLPGRIQLPAKAELERRELVVAISDGNALIEAAEDEQMRFVLLCGFHAGLRRGEIMHARPAWFDVRRTILRVPRVDEVGENKFRVKDSESREIPLSAEFVAFLRGFLPTREPHGYCLRNPRKRRSKAGIYDFRRPFAAFVAVHGHAELFPHAMRHSWITELCNSGNHTVQEVAAWSGDRIETIEANYWHKRATPGALDSTLRGERRDAKSAEAVAEILRLLKAGKATAARKIAEKLDELPGPETLDEYSDPDSVYFIEPATGGMPNLAKAHALPAEA